MKKRELTDNKRVAVVISNLPNNTISVFFMWSFRKCCVEHIFILIPETYQINYLWILLAKFNWFVNCSLSIGTVINEPIAPAMPPHMNLENTLYKEYSFCVLSIILLLMKRKAPTLTPQLRVVYGIDTVKKHL